VSLLVGVAEFVPPTVFAVAVDGSPYHKYPAVQSLHEVAASVL